MIGSARVPAGIGGQVSEKGGAASGPGAAEDPFGERFAPHADAVRRLCRQLLGGDRDAAEDAVGEVYLRAQRGQDGYDEARPLRPWLLAIASHHCIDRLRRGAREQRIFHPTADDEAGMAASGPSPLARMLEREERARLASAVEQLPPRYRAPLVLRYHAELSYEEIAARLGIGRAQVGTLLFRARRRLREALR